MSIFQRIENQREAAYYSEPRITHERLLLAVGDISAEVSIRVDWKYADRNDEGSIDSIVEYLESVVLQEINEIRNNIFDDDINKLVKLADRFKNELYDQAGEFWHIDTVLGVYV